jgi:hypothetical protein
MKQRALLSTVLACLLMLGLAGDASAGLQWCEADPAVVIATPRGSTVVVYLTNGVEGVQRAPSALTAETSYTAEPTPDGQGTHVHLFVLTRSYAFDSDFAVYSVASSGPSKTGTIYDAAEGRSDTPVELVFDLPVP